MLALPSLIKFLSLIPRLLFYVEVLWHPLFKGPTAQALVFYSSVSRVMIYRLTLDVTCPVLTTTNELYVIDTTNSKPGSTLLVEETKDNIIYLTASLKSNFKVDFSRTTPALAVFCTQLEVIPIQHFFYDNLWHIPRISMIQCAGIQCAELVMPEPILSQFCGRKTCCDEEQVDGEESKG